MQRAVIPADPRRWECREFSQISGEHYTLPWMVWAGAAFVLLPGPFRDDDDIDQGRFTTFRLDNQWQTSLMSLQPCGVCTSQEPCDVTLQGYSLPTEEGVVPNAHKRDFNNGVRVYNFLQDWSKLFSETTFLPQLQYAVVKGGDSVIEVQQGRKVRLLATPPSGLPLKSKLKQLKREPDKLLGLLQNVMLHVLIAISWFQRSYPRVQHNDLTVKNISLTRETADIDHVFTLGAADWQGVLLNAPLMTHIAFTSKAEYHAKADFDSSAMHSVPGEWEAFSMESDIFIFLHSLTRAVQQYKNIPTYWQALKRFFVNENKYSFLRTSIHNSETELDPDYLIDTGLKSVEEILSDPFFTQLHPTMRRNSYRFMTNANEIRSYFTGLQEHGLMSFLFLLPDIDPLPFLPENEHDAWKPQPKHRSLTAEETEALLLRYNEAKAAGDTATKAELRPQVIAALATQLAAAQLAEVKDEAAIRNWQNKLNIVKFLDDDESESDEDDDEAGMDTDDGEPLPVSCDNNDLLTATQTPFSSRHRPDLTIHFRQPSGRDYNVCFQAESLAEHIKLYAAHSSAVQDMIELHEDTDFRYWVPNAFRQLWNLQVEDGSGAGGMPSLDMKLIRLPDGTVILAYPFFTHLDRLSGLDGDSDSVTEFVGFPLPTKLRYGNARGITTQISGIHGQERTIIYAVLHQDTLQQELDLERLLTYFIHVLDPYGRNHYTHWHQVKTTLVEEGSSVQAAVWRVLDLLLLRFPVPVADLFREQSFLKTYLRHRYEDYLPQRLSRLDFVAAVVQKTLTDGSVYFTAPGLFPLQLQPPPWTTEETNTLAQYYQYSLNGFGGSVLDGFDLQQLHEPYFSPDLLKAFITQMNLAVVMQWDGMAWRVTSAVTARELAAGLALTRDKFVYMSDSEWKSFKRDVLHHQYLPQDYFRFRVVNSGSHDEAFELLSYSLQRKFIQPDFLRFYTIFDLLLLYFLDKLVESGQYVLLSFSGVKLRPVSELDTLEDKRQYLEQLLTGDFNGDFIYADSSLVVMTREHESRGRHRLAEVRRLFWQRRPLYEHVQRFFSTYRIAEQDMQADAQEMVQKKKRQFFFQREERPRKRMRREETSQQGVGDGSLEFVDSQNWEVWQSPQGFVAPNSSVFAVPASGVTAEMAQALFQAYTKNEKNIRDAMHATLMELFAEKSMYLEFRNFLYSPEVEAQQRKRWKDAYNPSIFHEYQRLDQLYRSLRPGEQRTSLSTKLQELQNVFRGKANLAGIQHQFYGLQGTVPQRVLEDIDDDGGEESGEESDFDASAFMSDSDEE